MENKTENIVYRICCGCEFFKQVDKKLDEEYCPRCGLELLNSCEKCGLEFTDPFAKFCRRCGKNITINIDVNINNK